MDGFAYAGEALCGRLYGAGNQQEFNKTLYRLFGWGIALSTIYTLVYAIGGSAFLSLLTNDAEVIAASTSYLPWAVFIPLCGMAAFVWDGVFIGTTSTRSMLLSSALSALLFFIIYIFLRQQLHNHALWLAFLVYLAARGVAQTIIFKRSKHL